MLWVVSYDIPDDKRRRRVSKVLEGYGRRAQFSVFECEVSDEQRLKLERRLMREINGDEDDIRFYPLNRADLKRVRLLGRAKLERVRGFYVINGQPSD